MRDDIFSQSSDNDNDDENENEYENDHVNLLSSIGSTNDIISQISPTNNTIPNETRNKCENDYNCTTPISSIFPPNFFILEVPSRMMQARMAILSSNWNRNVSQSNGIHQKQTTMALFRILFAAFHLHRSISSSSSISLSSSNQVYDILLNKSKHSLNDLEHNEDMMMINTNAVKEHIEYLAREAFHPSSKNDKHNQLDEYRYYCFEMDLHLSAMIHINGMQLLQLREKEHGIYIQIHYEALKCVSIQEWYQFLNIDTNTSIISNSSYQSNHSLPFWNNNHSNDHSNNNIQNWCQYLLDNNNNTNNVWIKPKTLYDCLTIMCQRVDDNLLLHTQYGSMTVYNLLLQRSFPMYHFCNDYSCYPQSTNPSIMDANAITYIKDYKLYHHTMTHALKTLCHMPKKRYCHLDLRQISYGFNRILYKNYYLHLTQTDNNESPTQFLHSKLDPLIDCSTMTNDIEEQSYNSKDISTSIHFIPNIKWEGLYESYTYDQLDQLDQHENNQNDSIIITNNKDVSMHNTKHKIKESIKSTTHDCVIHHPNHSFHDIHSDSSDSYTKKIRYKQTKRIRLKRGVRKQKQKHKQKQKQKRLSSPSHLEIFDPSLSNNARQKKKCETLNKRRKEGR